MDDRRRMGIQQVKDNGIQVTNASEKVLDGWQGKVKCLLQVLWERGFIIPNNLDRCTLNGQQDAEGVLMHETSLKHLMASCKDLEEEKSLLQFYGHEMDVTVDQTPKGHCELAGEGNKYTWGCSKNYYCSLPLAAKKGRENFKTAVATCLDSNIILKKEKIRKFSRRAN